MPATFGIGRLSRMILSRLKGVAATNAAQAKNEDRGDKSPSFSVAQSASDRVETEKASAGASALEDFTPLLIDELPRSMVVTKIGFGTYTDQKGFVTFSPNNLLPNSNLFTGQNWSRVNCEISPTDILTPVSGQRAWRLSESSDPGAHYIYGKALNVINSHIIVSIFAKKLERNSLVLEISNFRTGSAACRFNLADGLIETASSTTDDYRDLAVTMTEYQDGWFRCSLRVRKGDDTDENYLTVSPALAAGNLYRGDGRSGLLIGCAQMEIVTYQTEPRPFFNTKGQPGFGLRFDHDAFSHSFRGLMIEQAAENLLRCSESFESVASKKGSWLHKDIKILANDALSPSGERRATRLGAGRDNATILYQGFCADAEPRTLSCWIRSAEEAKRLDYTTDGGDNWRSFEINKYWRRYFWPLAAARHRIGFRLPATTQAIEIWGAQLEQGEQATSYIPSERGVTRRQEDALLILDATLGEIELSIFDYAREAADISRVKIGKEFPEKNIAINGWRIRGL